MQVLWFFALLAFTQAKEFCYEDVKRDCSRHKYNPVCETGYGAFEENLSDLQQLANVHLGRSNQFLMLAKHFSNWQFARPSFHDVYMSASNRMFVDAIHLVRYITDRGGVMDFSNVVDVNDCPNNDYELYELESLAWALDVNKKIAQQTSDLHQFAGSSNANRHDGDLAYYLERQYAPKHREFVRNYVEKYVLLEKMLTKTDQATSLFDYDDFLGSLCT